MSAIPAAVYTTDPDEIRSLAETPKRFLEWWIGTGGNVVDRTEARKKLRTLKACRLAGDYLAGKLSPNGEPTRVGNPEFFLRNLITFYAFYGWKPTIDWKPAPAPRRTARQIREEQQRNIDGARRRVVRTSQARTIRKGGRVSIPANLRPAAMKLHPKARAILQCLFEHSAPKPRDYDLDGNLYDGNGRGGWRGRGPRITQTWRTWEGSRNGLAVTLGFPPRTVTYHLRNLIRKGFIHRLYRGNRKLPRWDGGVTPGRVSIYGLTTTPRQLTKIRTKRRETAQGKTTRRKGGKTQK